MWYGSLFITSVTAHGQHTVISVQGYGGSADPALNAFGGSSFGGICALRAATTLPDAFGAVLVESPSLWIAEERFLNELLAYIGAWPQVANRSQQLQTYCILCAGAPFIYPENAKAVRHLHAWQRTYLAMGSKEYSGIRPAALAEPEFDARLAAYIPALAKHLDSALGCGEARLLWEARLLPPVPPVPPVRTRWTHQAVAGKNSLHCIAMQGTGGGSAPAFPIYAGACIVKPHMGIFI